MNKTLTDPIRRFKLPMGVLGADVSPDGQTLFTACMDGTYQVDLESGAHERIDAHDSYVSSAVHLAGPGVLLTAGYDGAIHWIRLADQQRYRHIRAHNFWSWRMAATPDGTQVISATGQYLPGGYRYEPLPEKEPSVRVLSVETGEVLQSWEHVPPVQALAVSPDGRWVAAGNLMGEVRVWDLATGEQLARWTTPDFTSWGIIKTHSYIGGIFALQFTRDGNHLLLAGMGDMRDPMAGNGRQLWQKFAWRETPPRKAAEIRRDDAGEGLMEALAVHPDGTRFLMAGRLRGGSWNAALFDLETGRRLAAVKTDCRITAAKFLKGGSEVVLVGMQGQPKLKDGKFPSFGRIDVCAIDA